MKKSPTSQRKMPPKQTASQVQTELLEQENPEKAANFRRFFKTGPGEYAAGDQFLGVTTPKQRQIASLYSELPPGEIEKLLASPVHECRLTAIFILVNQFERAKSDDAKKTIYEFYISHTDRINNWDLVDSSCHKIMGPYLKERSRKKLFQFARAKNDLWKNRIAIVTTFYFIRRGDLETTIELSEILLDHEHDLIHKAVGWMLRELGQQNETMLMLFLKQHYNEMSRTTLRYAIEKSPAATRKKILAGNFFV
ncbi:MAG: DNA alkylation repair protein [Mariniblastus sp.]